MQPSAAVTATSLSRFAGLILFVLTGIGIQYAEAQPGFVWAKQYVSTKISLSTNNRAHSVNIDKQGNIIIGGIFTGIVDFDPGSGVNELTANTGTSFVTKLDASGNFVWVAPFEGSSGSIVYNAVPDKDGNILVTGQFKGTVDFDPGPGTYNLTTSGSSLDIFVCKLSAAGNLVWCKQIGGAGNEVGNNLALDDAGNVYVTGYFYYTVDFDPGPGVYNLTSTGTSAAFILKLNLSGDFVWAKAMIDPSPPYTGSDGYSIALDKDGNVYTTGNTSNQCDFDPGPGTFFLPDNGIFISKLDNNGNFVWAKGIGGVGNGTVNAGHHFITIDKDNNVLLTGSYTGTVDFNPGSSFFNMTAVGLSDMYVVKIDNAGNFLWAKSMGGTDAYTNPTAVVADNSGNVYTTGVFGKTTVDFDPGSGTYNLICEGNYDIFINMLDASGNFVCAGRLGGSNPSADQGNGWCIAVDASMNIFVSGNFIGTVDFDPGTGTHNLSTSTIEQCFLSKYSGCAITVLPEAKFAASDTAFCNPKCINFNNSSINATTWDWSFPGASPSSSTDQNPQNICYNAPGKYTVTLIVSNGTEKDTLTKINYINSGSPAAASVSISASELSICSGAFVTFSATPDNGGTTPAYQWKVNGNNAGSNDSTFTSNALYNNDIITVEMTSSEGCVSGSPATSNSIIMSVTPFKQAGMVSAFRDTICSGTPANLTVSGNSGTIQWQSSADNVVFADISNAQSNSLFDFPLTNTYYRVYTGSGMCDDTSVSQKIIVNLSPVADFNYTVTGGNGLEVTFNSDNSQDATAFDWDFGDGSKSTLNNPVHPFPKDTVYHTCLTVTNGSNCSFTVCRDINLSVGIAAIAIENGWYIYPVPFDNQLFISSPDGHKLIESVELTDVLGRTVFIRSFHRFHNNALKIELPQLAAGMYFVRIITEDGYFVQPVIKK